MESYPESQENEPKGAPAFTGTSRFVVGVFGALVVLAGLAFGYGLQQHFKVSRLAAQESTANSTISDLQRQLDSVTQKLNEVAAAQQAPANSAAQTTSKRGAKDARGAAAQQNGSTDRRYKRLMAQFDAQQKQLKETQELVAKNRTDLEGNLNSTRDELNGSIAKTHEELVALEKRGERNYFEFDLEKSKQFQRLGPITLSLRKADTKHKSFDLQMIVDDNKLTKKNVNLYEPIVVFTENDSQPVQVVVNRVEKNHVHGYVSAPKYKPSELAANGAAAVTPAAAHPETQDANPPVTTKPQQ